MTKANYDAQKAEYNRTIQYTVAASMDGVTPDRVTDIDVQLSTSARTSSRTSGQGSVRGASGVESHAGAVNDACALSYKVKVYDPLLSYEDIRAQIVEAASSGRMDEDLHFFAAQFNATQLHNGTFSLPQVSNGLPQRATSSQLTGAQIAGLVIGVLLFVALLVVLCVFATREKNAWVPPPQNVPAASAASATVV